jgi:SAM-dependent methyltransferase
MTESRYAIDQAWHRERERLASIEAALDPWEIPQIEAVGIKEGWNCLEIGAGGGSMTEWFCKRVGPTGKVVATDLDTRFVEAIEEPNLEVRKHDIAVDKLEENYFDIIHARAVMEHVTDRQSAIRNMVGALKPGGYLIITSGDYSSFIPTVDEDLFLRVSSKFLELLSLSGFDPNYGRRVRRLLDEANLVDVRLEGYVIEWGGDLPGTGVWRLLFEQLSGQVVERKMGQEEEITQFLSMIREPNFRAMGPVVVTGRGRKTVS